jgi:hypothetical protein
MWSKSAGLSVDKGAIFCESKERMRVWSEWRQQGNKLWGRVEGLDSGWTLKSAL